MLFGDSSEYIMVKEFSTRNVFYEVRMRTPCGESCCLEIHLSIFGESVLNVNKNI